jgi:hypothetical protein
MDGKDDVIADREGVFCATLHYIYSLNIPSSIGQSPLFPFKKISPPATFSVRRYPGNS